MICPTCDNWINDGDETSPDIYGRVFHLKCKPEGTDLGKDLNEIISGKSNEIGKRTMGFSYEIWAIVADTVRDTTHKVFEHLRSKIKEKETYKGYEILDLFDEYKNLFK